MTLEVVRSEAQRNFSNLSVMKKNLISYFRGKMNYLSIPSVGNITKSLSLTDVNRGYTEDIQTPHPPQTIGYVVKLVKLIFLDLGIFVVFVSFSKFVISYNFFSHST